MHPPLSKTKTDPKIIHSKKVFLLVGLIPVAVGEAQDLNECVGLFPRIQVSESVTLRAGRSEVRRQASVLRFLVQRGTSCAYQAVTAGRVVIVQELHW